MNKQETIQAINDFVKFNKSDILDLYLNQPEIAKIFGDVLNLISKEYGSGEELQFNIPAKKEEKQKSFIKLKVGDKVYMPSSKRGKKVMMSKIPSGEYGKILTEAYLADAEYLYITKFKYPDIAVLDINLNASSPGGDWYLEDELLEYPGNLDINDIIEIAGENYLIIDFSADREKAIIKNTKNGEISEVDLFGLVKNIEQGVFFKKISPEEETNVKNQIEEKKYKQKIITIPTFNSTDFNLSENRGDRPSPTTSAGDLYRKFNDSPKLSFELLNMYFLGNDNLWYQLTKRGKTWSWKLSKPQPSQNTKEGAMSKKDLSKLLEEIESALQELDASDPEYLELMTVKNKIIKELDK